MLCNFVPPIKLNRKLNLKTLPVKVEKKDTTETER
jgi:hypothetical protein